MKNSKNLNLDNFLIYFFIRSVLLLRLVVQKTKVSSSLLKKKNLNTRGVLSRSRQKIPPSPFLIYKPLKVIIHIKKYKIFEKTNIVFSLFNNAS